MKTLKKEDVNCKQLVIQLLESMEANVKALKAINDRHIDTSSIQEGIIEVYEYIESEEVDD